MSARLTVCILLLGASLPALARTATAETSADSPCPSAAAAPQAAPLLDANSGRRGPAASASKSRPATSGGGEIESTVRGPRWHSFLPGMFR